MKHRPMESIYDEIGYGGYINMNQNYTPTKENVLYSWPRGGPYPEYTCKENYKPFVDSYRTQDTKI